MNRISRLFSTAGGVALGGLRARITAIGGNEPMPYAFTDGGALIHDGNCWTSPLGIIDVYITSEVGARITVFRADNSILFQQDIGVQVKPGTTVASDPQNTSVPAVPPTPTNLLVQSTFELPEGNFVAATVYLVYGDGTFTDDPFAAEGGVLTTDSLDTGVALVDDETGEITAVAPGSTTVTYTFTPTVGAPLVATTTVTVTNVVELAPTQLLAQSAFTDFVVGNTLTVSPFLVYNDGTVDVALPFTGGTLGAVSNDTNVVTVVASTGVLTAVGAGSTLVIFTFTPTVGAPLTAAISVTVVAA